MQSVTAVGQKISTRIRQAHFDPLNVEAFMYMGQQVVPMYAKELKRSTWAQISWNCLQAGSGENDNEVVFQVNGMNVNLNSMDYLLAIALEAVFPQITLANTKAPCCYKYTYGHHLADQSASFMLMNGHLNKQLYFYASDGKSGLPDKTLYIGSCEALSHLGVYCHAKPLCQLSERHKVSWGQNALLAALETVSFTIDGVEYEELSNHVIYNALQQRMREDVFPVAGLEATSLPAYEVTANQDNQQCAVLGNDHDDLYRAFVVPFSFTTSALADRGENGKWKSAFPVMLACKNILQVKVNAIKDLRDALILQKEALRDYAHYTLKFVATQCDLYGQHSDNCASVSSCGECGKCDDCECASHSSGSNCGDCHAGDNEENNNPRNLYFSCGNNVFKVYACNFSNKKNCGGECLYMTGEHLKYSVDNQEACTLSNPKVGALHLGNIDSACRWETVTRPSDNSDCHDRLVWKDWIVESNPKLAIKAKALGAIVTDLERGMMKSDCRSKKWLYEKYFYYDAYNVKPGDTAKFDITPTPGQFKYAYTFAQNETSRLQGNFFNYTNDTDFFHWKDNYHHQFPYVFDGKSAISNILTRIQGYKDEDHPANFYRFVDGALFAQRAPRERGLFVTPRYANWINSIYPDGSINTQAINSSIVCVKTCKSGSTDVDRHNKIRDCNGPCSVDYHDKCEDKKEVCLPNTFGYNVFCVAVAWNMALFELAQSC